MAYHHSNHNVKSKFTYSSKTQTSSYESRSSSVEQVVIASRTSSDTQFAGHLMAGKDILQRAIDMPPLATQTFVSCLTPSILDKPTDHHLTNKGLFYTSHQRHMQLGKEPFSGLQKSSDTSETKTTVIKAYAVTKAVLKR